MHALTRASRTALEMRLQPALTAATRSLLNTAKLMEDNPLGLRRKELESIERLVDKVGRMDLHAGHGAGHDALLTRLVRLQRPE